MNTQAPTRPPNVRHELLTRDSDDLLVVTGAMLGFGTSESTYHSDHPGDFCPKGKRCSACRWFEVRIIEVTGIVVDNGEAGADHKEFGTTAPPAKFLVHTIGRTEVPGERQYVREEWVNGGLAMVEALTVRKVSRGKTQETFITGPSLKALSIASEFDEGIRDAYVNRALV